MCDQLDSCCLGLDSNKIIERKKSVENLRDVLNKEDVIKILNKGVKRSWDTVFNAVHRFIKKEGEKLHQDELKQKCSFVTSLPRIKSLSHPLLILVASKANAEEPRLNVTKVIENVLQCFESHYLRKYFGDVYLTVLVKYVLSERKYWGKISNDKWQDMYELLKELYTNNSGVDRETIFRGLYLTIKHGSMHSSLNCELRQDFNFIKTLCCQLKSNNYSNKQEIVLQVVLSFNIQLAIECRMASCKLGETISRYLIDLYEPRVENFGGKKSLIFDFFLLQIRLHHPNGVLEGDDTAYAFNWTDWKSILRSLYSVLLKEIDTVCRKTNISTGNNYLPELWPNFLALFVEVIKQVFNSGVNDITQATVVEQYNEITQIAKRPRIEVGIPVIISAIQTKDNWPWLCILSELLAIYPETITNHEFVTILDILANLQAECDNVVTRHYLYKLLNVMVQAQERLTEEYFDVERIEFLWSKIWETTLRSVGLNQNEDTTHQQLQSMLKYSKCHQPLALLNIFTSGVFNFSSHSIKTLFTLCHTIILPEFSPKNPELVIRKYLINFILGMNNEKVLNYSVYSEKVTAQILAGLVIKIWPYKNNFEPDEENTNREYKLIEDSYILSSFEGGLLFNKQNIKLEEEHVNHIIHSESLAELTNCVENFCNRLCTNDLDNSFETMNLINGIILILNLISTMLELKILTEENYANFIDINKLLIYLHEAVDKQKHNINLNLLKNIEIMISNNYNLFVSTLLRQALSVNFLKIFFDLSYPDEVDVTDDMDDEPCTSTRKISKQNSSCSILNENSLKDKEKTNLATFKILTHYICVPGAPSLNQTQKFALETLSNSNFDPNNEVEFQMTIYLLRTLNTRKIGTISNNTIDFILTSFQKLMDAKFEDYDASLLLLQILRDAIPHIYSSGSNESKKNTLILIDPFYKNIRIFGPGISVAITECFGNIVKMNLTIPFENTEHVVKKLIEFLKSDCHEVRLSAIKNVLTIFTVNSDSSKSILEKQNEMLIAVNKKILELFVIDGNINEEQQIDEIVNRTSSALHMYSSLITAYPFWRKKTLYFLVEFAAIKKLNCDLIKKIFTIIVKYLDIKEPNDFLNNNMNYLISQWSKNGHQITDFPFTLFGCNNSNEFFIKYINIVIPILLQQDNSDILKTICIERQKSITEVIKDCYPDLLAQFLPFYVVGKSSDEHNISNDNLLLSERLFKQMDGILNCDKDSSLIINKLDQVFIKLLYKFFDCNHFNTQFNFMQILPEPDPPFYKYEIFHLTLHYIEKKISSNISLVKYCINNCPNKLENILLEATVNHFESKTLEEKLTAFHRYSVLVDCIIQELQSHNKMTTFLIRNITYTLIKTIKLNKDKCELLSIAACRYFKTFCLKCLPFCKKIFEKLLIFIVNILVPISKLDTKLSKECVIVLNLIIVENSKYLFNSIGSLDPFPEDEKFNNIQEVYEKIKYGNDTFTLEQEIRHFLNVGKVLDIYNRIEGLQHLRIQLSTKKSQLNEIYLNLNKLRGFCYDQKNSIIHQLICMLVKLTTASSEQVRLEALRCLGELGPADLTTLILNPEQTDIDKKSSPVELVAGQVIVLLSQYLVSHKPKVAKATSSALYAVVSSKEGYIVATNEDRKDYGTGIIEPAYIYPFLPSKKPNISTNINVNETDFYSTLDQCNLWCPTSQCCHPEWISILVSKLLKIFPEKSFLQSLIPVCEVKTEFSEQMLPLIIYLILWQNLKHCTSLISRHIANFFENHWLGSVSNKGSLSQASTDSFVIFNRASVQCMLNVVHFIRLRKSVCPDKEGFDELQLNYLHVAQGAQFCSAFFTSILYAELWCYNKLDENPNSLQNTASTLETVCDYQTSDLTLAFENMLREAYKKIGEVDAMYGCGTSYILDKKSRIEYYKNIGRWDKVILHYDTQLGSESLSVVSDLANALKNNSLHYLASNIKSEELNSQYECAWRLNKWNFNTSIDNRGNDFEKYHYLALKCLHEADLSGMNQAISQARTCVINNLTHASLESSKSLYKPLTALQMLQDIENFAEGRTQFELEDLLTVWKKHGILKKNDFEYIEPILAQRIAMLNDIYLNDNVELVKSHLVDMHLELADEARTEGFYHVAHRALNNLSLIKNLTSDMRNRMMLEQAQLSWLDDKTSGRYLLKYLIENNNSLNLEMHGTALKIYGNWMVETRSENPSTIIENYFKRSVDILNNMNQPNKENLCDVIESYARFADAQYQQVSNYINSAAFMNKIQTIKKFRDMAKILKQPTGDITSDKKRAIALYERQSQIDQTEVNNAFKEKTMYLNTAVTNYLRILELSDSYDLKLFRILSLSLEKENKTNEELLDILRSGLPKLLSYKFIPLLPQIVPHIDNNQNLAFEKIIHDLLERCAVEHPFHTLPIILALADSYKDRNFDTTCGNESVETRVQTAKDLIKRLKKKNSLTDIIKNMETVSTALISLAYVDSAKCQKGRNNCNIPRGETIKSIKNIDNILLPTINLEIQKNKNYTNIIGIREFSSNFVMVGGINAPKKITCVGTDGIQRTVLVKGKDDLRQDAVMQQVFNIMNTVLAKNKQTSKLLIRTYKVVPLSQRSGVIEWCENTEPLGSYLNDAHKKYNPNDMTPSEARVQLRSVHAKDPDVKLKKYKEVCSKVHPIFHMFFISSYPQPSIWFERRRAYMHSVATSSMVGYILGLGDRHVHNILLDVNTAEVIHIDFGIAFEQGRVLPTPETVPFRLSRDIEAGMGICGIEGVFRRSCEKTMHVLRQNAETVLTILEVLLYDPLYVWTITPAEAYSRQRDEDIQQSYTFSDDDQASVNVTAERALLRLKQKLEGTENGGVCSVEGQVELLLQQAKDPVNLSRLFSGWQAYL